MTQNKGNHAEVNGLNMYYEIHGTGRPLILLHGGVGAIEMFGEVLPLLADGRQVIAVDLQAHGRTADIDRPLSFELMADDIAALIKHLGLEKADLMGYSLGGGVALQTAIRHPEVVRKLVVVSTPFKRDGWYPEILAGMGQMGPEAAEPMKQTPMYQIYASVAPKPEDWPALLTKLGRLLGQDYDWSKDVAAMEVPTLIVVGDADSVSTAHAVEFFELLGGGKADAGWDGSGMSSARLAILPRRITTSCSLPRWRPPPRRSSTHPCRKPSDGGEYTITIKGEIVMTESQRNLPRVVSRDEWFAARKELLAKEKELTRQRDALNESVAPIEYNYRTRAEHEQTGSDGYAEADQPIERPGRSSFLRDGDSVYHTYSVYARGLETVGGSYYFLDETALGRQ